MTRRRLLHAGALAAGGLAVAPSAGALTALAPSLMSRRVRTLVVGLGAMGSATVYQLAKRGHPVLGIDQFAPPHTRGSTHGDTRVTRHATGEGAQFAPLAIRSYELWREIERDAQRELLTTNGWLSIGTSETTRLASNVAVAKRYRIPYELLSSAQIRERFPVFFRVRDEEVGFFEPGGGFVRPEACVAAQLALAERHGATIHRGEKVLEVRPAGTDVVVRTDADTYVAEQVVLTAGPWIPDLLGPEYANLFTITRQVLAWFAPTGSIAPFLPEHFPVFGWGPSEGAERVYGFPAIDGSAGGLKFGGVGGERTTATSERKPVSDEEVTAMYDRRVALRFPAMGPRCVNAVTCLYTMSPDSSFIIDRHPEYRQVLLVSPCSGHGFQHSAAIGEAVAELVTEGKSQLDVSPFGISRFRSAKHRMGESAGAGGDK